MTSDTPDIRLGEAASQFLATLTPEERPASQPDIARFVRWFGSQRPFAEIAASEVENYAERLSQSDTEHGKKIEIVRAFLMTAKKSKWTKTNLSVNLKLRRGNAKPRARAAKPGLSEKVVLTQEGHGELLAELAELKTRRIDLIQEIQRAAADKDFRENAPLHAAREEKGLVEGRIMELEATLNSATIMGEAPDSHRHVGIGHTVLLCDLGTGEEMRYMLVSPREVDLVRGRISCQSPIGHAVMGKSEGQTAEVAAPAGRIRYQIKRVE